MLMEKGFEGIELRNFSGHDPHVNTLIDSIGEDDFAPQFLEYVHRLCGADHMSILCYNGTKPDMLVNVGPKSEIIQSLHKIYVDRYVDLDPFHSPCMRASHRSIPTLFQMNRDDVGKEMREHIYIPLRFQETVVICGRAAGMTIGLSMQRPEGAGAISPHTVDCISTVAASLLSITSKHLKVASRQEQAACSLSSVEEMERFIGNHRMGFPRREVQVCARVLHGISTVGIGIDLDIGEQTVMTYRKRIYQRLQISCRHELVRWYIEEWNRAATL